MSGIGIGVGCGIGTGSAGAKSPNPNMLLWTEALDNAAWVKSSVAVSSDSASSPISTMTAETLTYTAGGLVRESATTASPPPGTFVDNLASVTTSWQRFSVTDSLGATTFTFSIYLKASVACHVTMRLRGLGGTIQCFLSDLDSSAPVFFAWGAQLESGPTPTTYVRNDGTIS